MHDNRHVISFQFISWLFTSVGRILCTLVNGRLQKTDVQNTCNSRSTRIQSWTYFAKSWDQAPIIHHNSSQFHVGNLQWTHGALLYLYFVMLYHYLSLFISIYHYLSLFIAIYGYLSLISLISLAPHHCRNHPGQALQWQASSHVSHYCSWHRRYRSTISTFWVLEDNYHKWFFARTFGDCSQVSWRCHSRMRGR